ncbi:MULTISPECIES: phage tail tape measure protein [Frankia]|nr:MULTISPECIES: phage tail tape measure protein [Frankia]
MQSVVGEAWAMVNANTKPALTQINAFFDKAMSRELVIKTRADISQVRASYDQVKVMARDLKPVVRLDVDGRQVMRGLDRVEVMARDMRPTVRLDVDGRQVMRGLDRVDAMARDMRPTVRVNADTAAAQRQVQQLRAEIAGAEAAGSAGAAAVQGGSFLGGGLLGQLKDFAAILGVLEGVHGLATAAHQTQDFEFRLKDLSTGAGEATGNLGMIADGMKSMSTQVGVTAIELEKGIYSIESDGYHGAAALQVLHAAAEGARTGMADMETVSTSLMTVMRSYEIPVGQANRAMSIMVETVAHGGVRMQDMALGMKTIAPVANALHVPLAEVTGAMATITSVTHDAASAGTGMRFMLQSMAAPSREAAAAMAEVGLEVTQVQHSLAEKGLVATLQLIEQHIGTTFPNDAARQVSALHAIVGGTRGFTAAAQLTGPHMQELIANTRDISEAANRAGKNVAGWSTVTSTLRFQVDRAKAGLSTFGIEAGTVVLPMVTLLLKGLLDLAGGIGGTLAAAIRTVSPLWRALIEGFRAGPGADPGSGVLGFLRRLGAFAHSTLHTVRADWDALVGAMRGQALSPQVRSGWLGSLTGDIATARGLWTGFAGGLRGQFQPPTRDPAGTLTLRPGRPAPQGAAGAAAAAGSAVRAVGRQVTPALTLARGGFEGQLNPGEILGWQSVAVRAGRLAREAFDGAGEAIRGMTSAVRLAVGWGERHQALVRSWAVGIGLVVGAIGAWRLATGALAAAQTLLNAVMVANPISLLVIGIGLLVGSLIYAYRHVSWFHDGARAAFSGIETAGREVWSVVSEAISAFIAGPLSWIRGEIGVFVDFWHNNGEQIKALWRETWAIVETDFRVSWAVIFGAIQFALNSLLIYWRITWDLVKGSVVLSWTLIHDAIKTALDLILGIAAIFIDIFTGRWGKLWGDVKSLVSTAFHDVTRFFSDFGSGALTLLYTAGKDIIDGMINGLKDAGKTVWTTIKDIGTSIIDGVKHFFGIKSPSTVMADIGGHIVGGLIKGIVSSGAGMGGIFDKIFSGALQDPWGWVVQHLDDLGSILEKVPGLATGLAKKAASGALSGLEHLGSSALHAIFGGGAEKGLSADLTALITQSLAINGLPASWAPDMARLVQLESGGNARAVNPTAVLGQHATGLVQMLPSTFRAHMLSGFGDIFNPLDNLISSERYIKDTYGSPDRIKNLYSGSYLGYDSGGILPPGHSLVLNATGAGEPAAVFTPGQWQTLQNLASGRSGGAAGPVQLGDIHVYLGDQKITDIIDVRIDHRDRKTAAAFRGGIKRG